MAFLLSLCALIGLECVSEQTGPPAEDTLHNVADPLPPHRSEPVPTAEQRSDQVAAILARPLFNPDRRPPPVPKGATVELPIPRLTGTVLGPFGRQAVLAVGERQISRVEGDEIAGWTIHDIGNGTVGLVRPDVPHFMRLFVTMDDARPVVRGEPRINEPFAWSNPCGRRHKADHGDKAADPTALACRSVLATVRTALQAEQLGSVMSVDMVGDVGPMQAR